MNYKNILAAHNVQPLPFALRGNVSDTDNYETMGGDPFLEYIERDWARISQSSMNLSTQMPLRDTGMLSLLRSQPNRAGSAARFKLQGLDELDQGDGRSLYTIQRTWEPVRYDADFGVHKIEYCKISEDAVQKSRKVTDKVAISKVYTSEALILDKKMIHCEDMSWQDYVAKEMAEHMRKYAQGFASVIAKTVATGGFVGAHPASGGEIGKVIDLPILKADGETSNPMGLTILKMYAEKHKTYGTPMYLIGGDFLRTVDTYAQYKQQSCSTCHQINEAAVNADVQSMFIYDNDFQRKMRDQDGRPDNKLVWGYVPGALTLVTRTINKGDFVENHENDKRYTMFDPYFGLEHDVYWKQSCGKTYRYSMQYSIQYDVFGYPPCLTQDPCFKNVNDIVMFRLTCEDTNLCDFEFPNCEEIDVPIQELETECLPHTLAECVVPCKALFSSSLQSKCYFSQTLDRVRPVDSIAISGIPIALSRQFSLTNEDDIVDITAEINAIINPMGGSVVSISSVPLGTSVVIDMPSTAISFTLQNAGEVTMLLQKECKEVVCYKNLSRPKTGGAINMLSWVMPDGTTIAGMPGAPLDTDALGDGYTGTVDSFCVDVDIAGDEGQEVILSISDTKGCEGSFTGINYVCADTDGPVVTPGGGDILRGVWADCPSITSANFGGVDILPIRPYTSWTWGATTANARNIYESGSLKDRLESAMRLAGFPDAQVDIPTFDPAQMRSIEIVVSGLPENSGASASFASSICPQSLELTRDGGTTPPVTQKVWTIIWKGTPGPNNEGAVSVGTITGPSNQGWNVYAVCSEAQPVNTQNAWEWVDAGGSDAHAATIGGTVSPRVLDDPTCAPVGSDGKTRTTATAKKKRTSSRRKKK